MANAGLALLVRDSVCLTFSAAKRGRSLSTFNPTGLPTSMAYSVPGISSKRTFRQLILMGHSSKPGVFICSELKGVNPAASKPSGVFSSMCSKLLILERTGMAMTNSPVRLMFL
ncbi:hypothetical protein ES703_64285 [subsurface metagenome]